LFYIDQAVERQRKKQMRRMETAEMCFLGAVAGNRMADRKRNDDIREVQRITDINTTTKYIEIQQNFLK
jgi:hypothetical protein